MSGGPNYKRIRVPHPITGERIKVSLHVYVWLIASGEWEKGRITTPEGHELHHVNFNPFDNSITNLQLVTHSEHKKIHWEHDRPAKLERFLRMQADMTPEQIKARQEKRQASMKEFYMGLPAEERKKRMAAIRRTVLTEDDVREIRRIYPTLKGERGKVGELQRRFNLNSPQHLRAVANGRLFPNVK